MLELVKKIKNLFIKEKPFEIVVKDNKIQIYINSDVELIFKNDFDISIDGNVNIISNNFHIDTAEKLYLNSKTAKQIKDLPESIEYKQKLEEFRPKMQEITNQLSKESIPLDISDEEKIKQLSKLIPLDITNARCL